MTVDLTLQPGCLSPDLLRQVARGIRQRAPFCDHDRLLAPKIEVVAAMVRAGAFRSCCAALFAAETAR